MKELRLRVKNSTLVVGMTGGWHAQPGLRLSTIGAAASVLGLAPVGTRGRMRGGRSGEPLTS